MAEKKAGDDPGKVARHSFRSDGGGCAAKGDSERKRMGVYSVTQWCTLADIQVMQVYCTQIVRNSRVRVMYGAKHRSIETTSELEYVNGLLPLGVSIVRDCVC